LVTLLFGNRTQGRARLDVPVFLELVYRDRSNLLGSVVEVLSEAASLNGLRLPEILQLIQVGSERVLIALDVEDE
jgi:hypothetical protein